MLLIWIPFLVIFIIIFTIGINQNDQEPNKRFVKSKRVDELLRQYTTKQLKHLKSINQIETYSIEKLDNQIKELIDENIAKFSELLRLEGLNPPDNKTLAKICYSENKEIISSVNNTLKMYLRGQLLEEDFTEFDIQLEIDNLLSKYEEMENSNIGKE
ncbi:MAG: hypothetical protein GPJ54_20800 [Candidatus Heimdallarchaeota archaeon]|nr:hypothetical protein [Candidatus Heimdallarchaeota archaeon]